MTTSELKAFLENLAGKEVWEDDPDSIVDDFAGGNVDDAYDGGFRAGQTILAREILDLWEDAV